jgi:hypothetical protein
MINQYQHQAHRRHCQFLLECSCFNERQGDASQVKQEQRLSNTPTPGKLRRCRGMNCPPRNADDQHYKRTARIDHPIQTTAKAIGCFDDRNQKIKPTEIGFRMG